MRWADGGGEGGTGADEAEALELRGGVGAQRHHPDVGGRAAGHMERRRRRGGDCGTKT